MEHLNKDKIFEEMSIVHEAVAKAFQAEKMNIELLGMVMHYAYWHLLPRKQEISAGIWP